MQMFLKQTLFAVLLSGAAVLFAAPPEEPGRQTLRFVQDDAQDYMVSKIYTLKYVQANDITPFVSGMVKRYNMNSSVNCIQYLYNGANSQMLTVTCPTGMMPYVDRFIAMVDRNIQIDGHTPGEIIKGSGITRAVYRPKYRSGQTLVNLIVNAFINAGPYGSVYGYDANSNQIYWKDNTSNTSFVYQFLGFIDRPPPQISLHFQVYEVRESTLRDLGIDYVAWKNGPGLNIFQAAFQAFDLSSAGTAAMQAMSGPMSGFFFAPQFDASFIRVLEQSGNAEIRNTADLTVSNSDTQSYTLSFNPQLQNIVKSDNDRTTVNTSAIASGRSSQIQLKITKPILCMHEKNPVDFTLPDYRPGSNAGKGGILYFGYDILSAAAVERNNYGLELIDTVSVTGNANIDLNQEKILSVWESEQQIEQKNGVPWLSDIPYLGYLFSTVTTSTEKSKMILTVTASLLNTAVSSPEIGVLKKLK